MARQSTKTKTRKRGARAKKENKVGREKQEKGSTQVPPTEEWVSGGDMEMGE